MRKIKIICTLGPSSFNKSVLKKLRMQKVDILKDEGPSVKIIFILRIF